MSEKTLKRIVVAVALLFFGYGLLTIVRTGLDSDEGGEGSELARVVSELDPSEVREVFLIDGGDTVRLAREDDRWTVNGFRADSGRVARFWSSLTEEDPGDPVVVNPENHARLGITEDQASRVVVIGEDGERHEFLLGDSGPSYPSVYIRMAGSDAVHLLNSSLSVSAGQGVVTWRDHTIVRVDTSRVRNLEVSTLTDSYTLSREEDGGWSVGGEPAGAPQVRNLLGGLNRVLASDFYDVAGAWPESVSGPETDERRLVALAAPGDTLTALTVRGSDEGGLAVRVRDDSTVYEIAPFDIARLFPPRASLLPDDPGDERDDGSGDGNGTGSADGDRGGR